jgi:hypothetical protein
MEETCFRYSVYYIGLYIHLFVYKYAVTKLITLQIIVHFYVFLHDVHEMNAYRAGHVCLSAWFNSRTARRIWMKFGMDIISFATTLKSYFSIFYNR